MSLSEKHINDKQIICNFTKIAGRITNVIDNFEKIGIIIEGDDTNGKSANVGCDLYGSLTLAYNGIRHCLQMNNYDCSCEKADEVIRKVITQMYCMNDFSDETIIKLYKTFLKNDKM